MTKGSIAAGATLAVIAFTLVALARGLPADTFSVGDPGVKLIATHNAIERPGAPFEIPIPSINGEPLPYLDPFYASHNDHAHAVTPEVFPLISAPFVAAFGMRGAYILPACGFLLAIAACAWLAVVLDPRRSPTLVMLMATLTTPLVFYGLEFWEHAPAAGLAALASALFVTDASRAALSGPLDAGLKAPRYAFWGAPLGAGLLFGIAILLRPETVWFAVAVLVASWWLPTAPSKSAKVFVVLGMVIAFIPLALYTMIHLGSLLTPHMAGNPGLWSSGWISRRSEVVWSWFLNAGTTSFWRVGPAAILALVPMPSGFDRRGRRFLAAAALISVALIALTTPSDGGSQWGPRYLLAAYLPLTVLAADTLQGALARHRTAGALIVALVLAGGAWIQRASYNSLQEAKVNYGRVLAFVEDVVPAGGYAVSDLWWLDQIAAAAAIRGRVFLFAADEKTGGEILRRLDTAGADAVTVIRSREESLAIEPWMLPACYGEDGRREIPERTLVAVRLRRTCA